MGMGQKSPFLEGMLIGLAAALPVVMSHEAIEGSERADAHHDEVAGFAGGHRDLVKMSQLCGSPPAALRLPGAGASTLRPHAGESGYSSVNLLYPDRQTLISEFGSDFTLNDRAVRLAQQR